MPANNNKPISPVVLVRDHFSQFQLSVMRLIGTSVEVTDKSFPLHGSVGTVESLRASETGVYIMLQVPNDKLHEVPLICVTSLADLNHADPQVQTETKQIVTH